MKAEEAARKTITGKIVGGRRRVESATHRSAR
jgi:hypothetical protein